MSSRNIVAIAAAAAVILCAVAAQAVENIPTGGRLFYVKIEGAKQGVFKVERMFTSKARADWGAAYKLSYEVVSPRDMASGMATGKRQHKPITLSIPVGGASAQLFQAWVTNEVLKSVQIEFERPGSTGVPIVYYAIRLTNASIASLKQYIDGDLMEDVTLTFQRIEIVSPPARPVVDDWMARQ